MFRLVVLSVALAACVSGQLVDPKDAKILKEQRFNVGDGRAGSAFATEDGVVFKEETDIDGNRIGQYSYVGEDGQTYTVKYSAGKDGFRILEGSHIVATGQEAAPFDASFQEEEPLPQQPIVPEVRSALPPQPQVVPQQVLDYDLVEEEDPNRNPFINPHDPTHRDFAFNKNGATFEPRNAGVNLNANLVPDCANCAGVNPFVNPFDASHSGVLAGHLAGHLAGQPAFRQQPAQPVQPIAQPARLPAPRFEPPTTTSAPRFFPPGQLKLNRFETGFNFDFES